MSRHTSTSLRTTATIAGTLLVIVVEMAVLTAVWHIGDGLARQREAVAVLSGASRAEPVAASAVREAVTAVRGSGVDLAPGTPGARVVAAATDLESSPSDASALRTLQQATSDLGADLDRRSSHRAWTAFGIHGGLLAVASIGWFIWFRRLVDRHRGVERRLTAQQVVDQHERRLLALVQSSADLITVVEPDGTLSFVSPSARQVLGRDPETLTGHRLDHLLGEAATVVLTALASGHSREQSMRLEVRHAEGHGLVLEGTLTDLLSDPSVRAWVLTLRDVSEQHRLAAQLAHQAFHDPLTGLANRALFADRLDHALARRREAVDTAVLFLDLDDFKQVNDTRGHSVGDRLLVVVADRLRGVLRPVDTAARLGGDEFAVILHEADQERAETVARRVLDALTLPVEIDGFMWQTRASIGIVVARTGEATSEETLRNADVAMYWAKEQGKHDVAVYDELRHAATLESLELQGELTRAMAEDELVLHFQPTVDLESGRITGFESLVRWQHPERGLLAPSDFVPAAERSGLIVPMGAWVLRQACRAAITLDVGGTAPTMAVNVSSHQLLRPEFVDEVRSALATSGLPGERLVLEMTESVLLQDFDRAEQTLTALRGLGVLVAIDDFGTGYSSLSYLSQLPVDILKIDKSFIDQVCSESHAASVTMAILEMSRSLRLLTVGEGVESPEQSRWLRERGCGRGQGYLWSRPVPVADARALLVALEDEADVGDTDPVAL